MTDAITLFPTVACWPLDNQGAATHLCLAISNRSRHKCRKCLIQAHQLCVPGLVAERRNFQESNLLAKAAQDALVKKWRGEENLTETEQEALRRCAFLNIMKTPTLLNDQQRCTISSDPYLSCPYDDLHTLSEGLLKAWVVWTVICMASVAQVDPQHYEHVLDTLDSQLMSFPSVMIPEVLRRHRFPQVNNVA